MSENGEPVGKWLSRVSDRSKKVYANDLKHFMVWLNQQKGWQDATPESLIMKQKNATGEAQFEILDKLQEYITGLDLRFKSKQKRFTAVSSFFMHNRAALPKDKGFKIRSKIAPTKGTLTVEEVLRLINSAGLRDSSIYLVKWQGLLDTEGLIYVNRNFGAYITAEIKRGTCPIRLQMTGRKGTRNIKPFYTFIGKDAINALKKYFEQEREGGYPIADEPIWYSNKHFKDGKLRPYERWSLQKNQLALARKLGMITQKTGDRSTRHGKSPHELRDVARSYLHVKGKPDGLDAQAIEYFMGHGSKLDQLGYDRFYEDDAYMLQQYLIMEKHLNVVSAPPTQQNGKIQARVEELEKKVAEAVIESNIPTENKAEVISKLSKIVASFGRGEGPKLSKAELAETKEIAAKLNQFAAILANGDELTERGELELMVYEQRAREICAKLYEQMRAADKTSKVKKLDFDTIVKQPKSKRP